MQSSGSAAAVIAGQRVIPQKELVERLRHYSNFEEFSIVDQPGHELDPGLPHGSRARGNHPGMEDLHAGVERRDAAARVRRSGADRPDAPEREMAPDPRWPRGRVSGRGCHVYAIHSLAALAPDRFRPVDAAFNVARPIRYCGGFPGNQC
jgi:hypothetical protein